MAFNGSGVFVRLYNWVVDKGNSVKITASRMDAEMDGMATGLSNCITKDGQTTITQNIPMNSKKLTGCAAATALTDVPTGGQIINSAMTYYAATGTDTYVATPSPAITAYAAGQSFLIHFANANTGAATLNLNSLGAKAIKNTDGGALTAGQIADDSIQHCVYDGTNMVLMGTALVLNATSLALTTLSVTGLVTLSDDIRMTDGKAIEDENGNEYILFATTASAVNELTVTNAATGNAPKIEATGDDTNIGVEVEAKGTGRVAFKSDIVADEARLSIGADVSLTIATGAVTTTRTNHLLGTEGGASTDDLDTINGGTEGDFLTLGLATASNNVVVKHNTGNIQLHGGNDVELDVVTDQLFLKYNGNDWVELGRNLAAATSDVIVFRSSSGATITVSSTDTFAHSLGAEPDGWSIILECTDAGGDQGYAQGDRVDMTGAARGDASRNIGVEVDSTNITVHISGAVGILNNTTQAGANIDVTKWELHVKAWKFN